jgi:predicted phage baseplate assembly protein
MSLPSPNLDDRTFQDLVDEVKRKIGLRCPEWTEHNVSDPGVTLLELFASLTEMTLYRMNQIPEKNHVRFLELLGISLECPEPATTDLRFRLTRPIVDELGAEAHSITLAARQTVASTLRTESEEAVEFATDSDLHLVRPGLVGVLAISGSYSQGEGREIREFPIGQELPSEKPFRIFSAIPGSGDALYLMFQSDLSMNIVALDVQCNRHAATGMDERVPSQVWEYWSASSGRWERVEVVSDATKGFNMSGRVELQMPRVMVERTVEGFRGFWLRCRYTTNEQDIPPKGPDGLKPASYQKPPELLGLRAVTVGGWAPASNAITALREVLGVSDGTPGQSFRLKFAPILALRADDETVLVGPWAPGEDPLAYGERWTRVNDFARSGPNDRHFTIDTLTGEIQFGPNVVQPDGSGQTYGAVPEKGAVIGMTCYRYGGGTTGNVRENRIRVLKRAIPYIAEVTNPRPATGGRDREELDRAKLRAREILQVRDRAVTAEDFEYLAKKASSSIGRACCVATRANGEMGRPGTVHVLLVPHVPPTNLLPRPGDLRIPERTFAEVREYLNERRLMTTVLSLSEPEYKYVSVRLKLVASPQTDTDQLRLRVIETLNRFIHPLFGGPNRDGWPFRRSLTIADVYGQIGHVSGVAFLLSAELWVSTLVNPEDIVFGSESQISTVDGVTLEDHEVLCSRQHDVSVVPMSLVGSETFDKGHL